MVSAINLLKGIFIGIALVVPGLSGSMFSVVVGLYDKLLDAINNFRKDIKKYFVFLLPIVIGVGLGILLSTKLVLWVCETYLLQSYSFFVGLVLGSIPLVYRKMSQKPIDMIKLMISFASFAVILFISYLSTAINGSTTGETYVAITHISGISDALVIFFAGVFSCSLMAIPGVSGSIMLMLINQYGTIYNAASAIGDMLKALLKGDMQAFMQNLSAVAVLIPFLLGAIVGFILIAKLLSYLMDKYLSEVYYGVMGLVIGAVAILFKDGIYAAFTQSAMKGFSSGAVSFLLIIIFIIIGYFCTNVLDKEVKK